MVIVIYIVTLPCSYIVPYGNKGCSCGDVTNSYMYVIDNRGLDTESSYPYVSRVSKTSQLVLSIIIIHHVAILL